MPIIRPGMPTNQVLLGQPRPLYTFQDEPLSSLLASTWTVTNVGSATSAFDGSTNNRVTYKMNVGNANAADGTTVAKTAIVPGNIYYATGLAMGAYRRCVLEAILYSETLANLNTTNCFFGLIANNATGTGATANIIGWRLADTASTTKVTSLTDSGGTETTNASALSIASVGRKLTLAVRGTGAVDFWIDGASEDILNGRNPTYTHTTNIPDMFSAYITFHWVKTTGTTQSLLYVQSIRYWVEE